MENTNRRPLALTLVVLGALVRLIPHPWNFAPVGGVSLFAGARLRGWQAYMVPILLMAVTDPFLGGFSITSPFVYLSFLINVWIGRRLRASESPIKIGAAAVFSSVQFFVLSDFGSWLGYYAHTWTGLVSCYVAAIPFYAHAVKRPAEHRHPVRHARRAEPYGLHARARGTSRLKRALVSWSGGKDCAWALERLRGPDVQIVALLTTINERFNRVAMHGVRRELVEEQARSIGVPLWIAPLPWPCSNERYEEVMAGMCRRAVDAGIDSVVFGDLFLEDVRAYRERMLAGTGLEPLFPLWQAPTGALAREMLAQGLRARIACIDRRVLDRSFAGREYDADFLADLPPVADPCGENGEFHSFVYDSPMFHHAIAVEQGEFHEDGDFTFADLLCPVSSH